MRSVTSFFHQPETLLAHEDFVRRTARSLLQGDADVDDVVQETWLRTLQQEHRPTAPRAWLGRVATNLALGRHREARRRAAREERAARPDRVSSTADVLAREELRRAVVEAVLALAKPQRDCIVARYFDDLPPREIAKLMSIPVDTVRSRIRRGRDALRQRLDREFKGDRAHWLGGLALLCGRKPETAVLSAHSAWALQATKGVAAMTAKTKLALAAVLVVALPVCAVQLLSEGASSQQERRLSDRPVLAADADRDLGAERGRAPLLTPQQISLGTDDDGSVETTRKENRQPTDPAEALKGAGHAMQSEYQRLKDVFANRGWLGVQSEIVSIRTLLTSEEGSRAFLRLLDAEADGYFLEALLHHMTRPGGGPRSLEALVRNEALHRAIWDRFEREEDPVRRASFLSFFSQNPRLRGKKTQQFLRLAVADATPRVRAASLDALWSIADRADVWPVLCDVAETDRDAGCRAAAVRGLTRADSERATLIVREAFTSTSEQVRAAVWESKVAPPADVVGEDVVEYLRDEFRRARTSAYKAAILDRLVEQSVPALQEELRLALRSQPGEPARRYYRAVLDILAGGGVEDRWDVRRHAKALYLRFRYGGD